MKFINKQRTINQLVILTVLVISTSLYSQNNRNAKPIPLEEFQEMVLNIEKNFPMNTSFAYEAEFLYFEQLESLDTISKSTFTFLYNAKRDIFNIQQDNRHIIQNSVLNFEIDSLEKSIILRQIVPDYNKRKTSDDFKALINSQCKAEKKTTSTHDIYYLIFPENALYLGIELWVSKKFELLKCIFYSGQQQIEEFEEKVTQPRLEIYYKKIEIGLLVEKKKIKNVDEYFSNYENITLKDRYKEFEIIDLR